MSQDTAHNRPGHAGSTPSADVLRITSSSIAVPSEFKNVGARTGYSSAYRPIPRSTDTSRLR
jgi:hypothetical protein